ncbi:sulfurtransferase [Marinomonas epiphytica]
MKTQLTLFVCMLFSALSYAEPLRVEVDELSQDLSAYKIIDVRDPASYQEGHIKGAVNFPATLTFDDQTTSGRITPPNEMQPLIQQSGIDINDAIAIYDDGSFFDAARLFWSLEVYGFRKVKLLNSSYSEWQSLGLPISTKPTIPTPSNYVAAIDNSRLATKFATQIASRSSSQTVIDARTEAAYQGLTSTAQRFGHIPQAQHIPATHNISSKNDVYKLKNLAELEETYQGISKQQKVIIYCAIGRVSSTNYFALRELGYDVANYDASWREWGNDFNLPINNPSEQ